MMDGRRPVFVDVCSDHMSKDQRATVLSIESQLRSFLMIIMAPLFGFIADTFSISSLFLGIGIIILIFNRFLTFNE
jgi:dTDP-4-amino-4,6-dideoxygalactose transaminase